VLAGGRRVETADEVHECGLARAGRPHDGDVLVPIHLHVHTTQGAHGLRAQHVILRQALDPDDGIAHWPPSLPVVVAGFAPAGGPASGRTVLPDSSVRMISYGPA